MKKITNPNLITCDKCGNQINIKRVVKSTFKTTKAGLREDLNISVRSGWEANICRYLNYLMDKGFVSRWMYEPKRFYFPNIKRGASSYLPDFCVIFPDGSTEWWEVKGYWTSRGKTAVTRFRKYFPFEKLKLIERKEYNEIKKEFAAQIPNWEMEKNDSKNLIGAK